MVYGVHTIWILGGKRGEHRASVNPIVMEYAKVGLHSGISATVASGDGQDAIIHGTPRDQQNLPASASSRIRREVRTAQNCLPHIEQ